jgi:hypothetical protein
MAAFVEGLADRATILRGRCLPYGKGITFHPLAEALIEAADLSEADTPEAARSKLAALAGGAAGRSRRGATGQASESRAAGPRPRRPWQSVCCSMNDAERPVVFVLDDLQWAEPKFVELVRHIAEFAEAVPLARVHGARVPRRSPGVGGDDPWATSLMPNHSVSTSAGRWSRTSSRMIRSTTESCADRRGGRRSSAVCGGDHRLLVDQVDW